MKHSTMNLKLNSERNLFAWLLAGSIWLLCAGSALANVTITAATGGTGISADNAQNGATPGFTTLGSISIREFANGEFAVGTGRTLILTAPTGWSFNPGVGSASSNNKDIPANSVSISVTASNLTVTFDVVSTANRDTLTISGIQV